MAAATEFVLEADSILVVNQILGKFVIRVPTLKPYFREIMGLIQRIRGRGQLLILRHIYREFNTVADELANNGVDNQIVNQNW